jgi:hypothetical protein
MTYNIPFLLQLGIYNWLDSIVDKKTDEMWAKYFFAASSATGGGIFGIVCDAVTPIALITVLFNLVQQIKAYNDNREDFKLFSKLLIPAFIALSLVGQGPVLKLVIGGLRDASNGITYSITRQFEVTSTLDKTLNNSFAVNGQIEFYKEEAKKCATSSAQNATTRIDCYKKLQTTIDNDPLVVKNSAAAGLVRYSQSIGSALLQGDVLKALDQTLGALNKINPLSTIATAFTNLLMSTVAAAIKNGLEISFLITALIAPLYVALAPLPEGYKALITWLSGFWSIFVFRLSYSIMVALAGTLYDNADGIYDFQIGIFAAIAAPILAGILAAGGGLGFYNAAVKLAATVASKGISFATGGK